MSRDIAFAASARDWPDRLHRHVLDYGGARVVGRLMSAAQCVDTTFDVIFIDDVCSFLSPRLVTLLRQRGRAVVGVYDPIDSADAKRRLLECGISDVIESDATAEEFVSKATAASEDVRPAHPATEQGPRTGRAFGVLGVGEGVGCTEVAVALAAAASRGAATTLVDFDPSWPAVLQRLDLAPHPNLRSLIDVTLHGGDPDRALQSAGRLRVAGGSVGGVGATPIPEATMVLGALAERCDVVIADLGAEEKVSGTLLQAFEAVILVSGPDPVALARMIRSKERLDDIVGDTAVLVAINRTPHRPFYRSEIKAEVSAALRGSPFVMLPFDDSMVEASWDGKVLHSGRFTREVSRIADLLVGAVVR